VPTLAVTGRATIYALSAKILIMRALRMRRKQHAGPRSHSAAISPAISLPNTGNSAACRCSKNTAKLLMRNGFLTLGKRFSGATSDFFPAGRELRLSEAGLDPTRVR
jgi:hypothetical protein